MERVAAFWKVAVRWFVGAVALAFLIDAIHDVWVGELRHRATLIVRSERPIAFWLIIICKTGISGFALYELVIGKRWTDR